MIRTESLIRILSFLVIFTAMMVWELLAPRRPIKTSKKSRMHHSDLDYDLTTGLRFHPIEILLSMIIKITVVVALGIPVLAVLIFEILLERTRINLPGGIPE